MLKNEIDTILNAYNNEDGITKVITESLIRYYSINDLNDEKLTDHYLNYLRTLFLGRQFHFLNKEAFFSQKDQILANVLAIIYDDISNKIQPEDPLYSVQWQPEALEAILTLLFDNGKLLTMLHN